MGTRLTIDSLTCLLANETDPSRLVAVSPGKLVRYLVADGAHVKKDQPYVEIEVDFQLRGSFGKSPVCCNYRKPFVCRLKDQICLSN